VRDHQECFLIGRTVAPPCPADATNYHSQGMVPEDCWGSYPTYSYVLGFQGPTGPFDFGGYGRQFSGMITRLFFDFATAVVSAALWLVGWALRFDVGDISDLVTRVGGRYQHSVVVPAGLAGAAWFLLFAYVGFNALRGKLAVAGSELLLSLLLASLAAVLIHDITSGQGNYVNSVSGFVEEASGAALMTATADDPNDLERVDTNHALRPFQHSLHKVFVEDPYDYLNWGHPLTGGCADARNNILSVSTGVGDDVEYSWQRRYMTRSGCAAEAEFNKDAGGQRWVGAMLNLIVAFLLLGVLALVAMTVVIAKFTLAACFAVAPFFAVAAVLPGRGRRLAWSWLATTAQTGLAVVAMSTLLSMMVVGAGGVMEATDSRNLFERWLLQLGFMGAVFFGRHRLLNSLNNFAHWMQDSLGRTSPVFANQPMAPPSGAGINLAKADVAGQIGLTGAAVVGVVAGRHVAQRVMERRIARRRLEVAKTIERYKEERDGTPRRMARSWRRGSPPRVRPQRRRR
jgi:hypothetical protein